MRAPFLIAIQTVAGLVLLWEPIRTHAIEVGTAELILAACVMGSLSISITVLMLLPGSIYESCDFDGGQI